MKLLPALTASMEPPAPSQGCSLHSSALYLSLSRSLVVSVSPSKRPSSRFSRFTVVVLRVCLPQRRVVSVSIPIPPAGLQSPLLILVKGQEELWSGGRHRLGRVRRVS